MATHQASNIGTLNAGDVIQCSYSGAKVQCSLPPGTYTLKCYGAQGGYRSSSTYGGKGGYSQGTLALTATSTTLYLYVGGAGSTGGMSGGFNGGGRRNTYKGGGGATDIRIGSDSLYARVIVAGGGGSDGATSRGGGAGGGANTAGSNTTASNYGTGGYGGGLTTSSPCTGGTSYFAGITATQPTSTSPTLQNDYKNGFGWGGSGIYRSNGYGGAGGGGWFGGVGTYPDGSGDDDKGGGGGSGYAYTSSTASNYPSGCLLNSAYYLTSVSGTSGSREGNGYIEISVVSVVTYTVTFAAGGGSGTMASGTARPGVAYTLPSCTFTPPSGKEFNGWNVNGTVYAAGKSVTLTGNTTVTATWKDSYYTLTFNANGGSGTMSSANVNVGSSYTFVACTFTAPTGKEFDKWQIDSTTYSVGASYTPTANKTVYATWKDAVRTITFSANGGSGSMSGTSVTYGGSYTLPACTFTAPDGHHFGSWVCSGIEYDVGETITSITSNLTILAGWVQNPYFYNMLQFYIGDYIASNTVSLNGTLRSVAPTRTSTAQQCVYIDVDGDIPYVRLELPVDNESDLEYITADSDDTNIATVSFTGASLLITGVDSGNTIIHLHLMEPLWPSTATIDINVICEHSLIE